MALLFYLEILEYNFCNLNRDTRKNIKEREIKEKIECDFNEENERNSTGDIAEVDGYLIKPNDIEMIKEIEDGGESIAGWINLNIL